MQKVEEVFAKADKQQERASIHSRLPTIEPGDGPECECAPPPPTIRYA
jgi:hypothetical protein